MQGGDRRLPGPALRGQSSGSSQAGKAQDFDSCTRWFNSSLPDQVSASTSFRIRLKSPLKKGEHTMFRATKSPYDHTKAKIRRKMAKTSRKRNRPV